MAFCAPTPAQYAVTPGKFYRRVPFADGSKFLALKVVTPTGAEAAGAPGGGCVALVAHGNGDDLGTAAAWLQEVSDRLDVVVVCWDYPGYGRTSGEASEAGVNETALLAYRYCRRELRPTDVLLLGKSLGTGTVMYLAQHKEVLAEMLVRGTMLLSPLASGVRTLSVARALPSSAIEALDGRFMPVLQYARRVAPPVTIVHGLDDTVIPVSNAYVVQAEVPIAFRTLMLELPFCGHNDMEVRESEKLWKHLCAFKTKVLVEGRETFITDLGEGRQA